MTESQEGKSLLTFAVVGDEGRSGYSSVMQQVVVQRLLLDIAESPRSPQYLDTALRGTSLNREVLESLGLVRRENNVYLIAFSLFTLPDVHRLRAAAEMATSWLVETLLARESEIAGLLREHPRSDAKSLAYIILGCFSLDWDGLALTAERGYRSNPHVAAGGGEFIPWAEERGDLSLKGIYWGSHNDREDDYCFTTFGDHYSLPRYAFPDLAWMLELPGHAAGVVPRRLKPAVERITERMVGATMRHVGKIMFALRDGEKSLTELSDLVGIKNDDASALVALLKELGYLSGQGRVFRADIPVLSKDDEVMVGEVRRIGWDVMQEWLSQAYEDIKAELSGLTPMRYGVPFTDIFPQVWHYLFGTANRQLVEAGLFADPYAHSQRYEGYIPAVWHQSLE